MTIRRDGQSVCLLDKKTDDAHDNPVINPLDDKGYIWIFSSSHGRGRPSYISRSVASVRTTSRRSNSWSSSFSYPEPFYYPGKGFLFVHTWYVRGRGNYYMTSNPGRYRMGERKQTAYFEEGHYQISWQWKDKKTGIAFNQHPKGKGLNWRTNVYYMESDDFGATWKTADGQVLETPLVSKRDPALVLEYESKNRNCYIKDVQFDSKDIRSSLFVLSRDTQSGQAQRSP